MNNLTKEEYTDLYKMCKKLNRDFLFSLRKVAAFLLLVVLVLGLAGFLAYPHPAWKMPIGISSLFLLALLFFIFFFMPTAWLKRRIKHFPGMTYQELKDELDSYL